MRSSPCGVLVPLPSELARCSMWDSVPPRLVARVKSLTCEATTIASTLGTTSLDLQRAIREAGFTPGERDTLYRRVERDGKAWRVVE